MESDVSRPSDDALELLRRAQWSERDPDGRAFAAIAEAHRLRGELHLAKTVAQEGIERMPDFASGHVVAGLVHRALRSPVEADVAFRRVLELDPENTVALKSMGELAEERDSHAEAAEYFRQLQLLDPTALEAPRSGESRDPEGVEANEPETSSMSLAAATLEGSELMDSEASAVRVEDLAPEEGSFEFSVADLDDVFKVADRDGEGSVAPAELPEGAARDAEEVEAQDGGAAPEWSWSPAPEADMDSEQDDVSVRDLAPDVPTLSVEDLAPDVPTLSVEDLAPDFPTLSVKDLAPETPTPPVADLAPDVGPVPVGSLAPKASPVEIGDLAAEDVAEGTAEGVSGQEGMEPMAPVRVDDLAPAPEAEVDLDPPGLPVSEQTPSFPADPGTSDVITQLGALADVPEAAAEDGVGDEAGEEGEAPAEDDFQAWLERNSL